MIGVAKTECFASRSDILKKRPARERAKEPIARAMALEHGGQLRRSCKKKMAGHCRQDVFRFAIRRKSLGTTKGNPKGNPKEKAAQK